MSDIIKYETKNRTKKITKSIIYFFQEEEVKPLTKNTKNTNHHIKDNGYDI